jgi:hypothetical protein
MEPGTWNLEHECPFKTPGKGKQAFKGAFGREEA